MALFVNEFQGALVEDLKNMVSNLVRERNDYRHDDPRYSDCERGNAHAHLRAALLGRSVAVGISAGELCLVLYGTGEAAELAYLTIQELGLELTGVVDGDNKGAKFLGLPVRPLADLNSDELAVVIVATFAPAGEVVQTLVGQGIPE
ncbi:MAG: YjbQ family protein [Candidatus Methylomirabilis sp.]